MMQAGTGGYSVALTGTPLASTTVTLTLTNNGSNPMFK